MIINGTGGYALKERFPIKNGRSKQKSVFHRSKFQHRDVGLEFFFENESTVLVRWSAPQIHRTIRTHHYWQPW